MKRLKKLFVLLLVAIPVVAGAQNQRVKGVVTDKSGSPLPGVSVAIEGTTFGVTTDVDGKYAIDAKKGQTLSFYFFGMKTVKVEVSGAEVNVKMEDDALALDEAVVTAMGISRTEKSIGYAATTVKSDEIVGQHASNVTTALAGKVAGLTISATSTDPGAAVNVVIRGYSSINGSNQPLYVVDGIIINNMSNIPSDDIESITVLKGAAATALYGSRAANGVLLISTKQGKHGIERNFTVEYTGGVQAREVSLLPKFQNSYGQGWNGEQTFIENGSWGPYLDGSEQLYGPIWNGQQKVHLFKAQKNNIRDFFEVGWSQNHNIAMNGTSDDQKMTYYLSYTINDDNGIMPGDYDTYKRNSIAYRSTYTPVEWLKFSSQVNFATAKTKEVLQDQGTFAIDGLYEFPRDHSLVDLKDLTNAFNTPEAYLTPYGITNPYWALANNYDLTDSKQIFGKIQIDVKPIKPVTLSYRFGFNYRDYDWKSGTPQISLDDALIWDNMGYAPAEMNQDGNVYAQYYRYYETNHDFLASYNDSFLGGDLTVNATAGVNINERYATTMAGQSDVLAIETGFWNLSNGASWTTLSESQSKRRLIGLFADVTLGYKDTYFLEISARNDWSSTLPVENNNFFYPGVTGSWIFTNNMEKNDILSFGKLRVAYGMTGNDASPYNTNPVYAQAGFNGYYGENIAKFPINSVNAFRRGYSIPSTTLKPEMTTEFEIGTDLKFFGGRIGLDAAYYNRMTYDQLFNVSVDPATGYSSQMMNAGNVRNKGVELLLSFTPVQTKDFRWDIDINWAKNINTVVDVPEEIGDKIALNAFGAGNSAVYMYLEKGKPYGTYWCYMPTYIEDKNSEYYGKQIVDEYGQPVLTKDLQPTGYDANYKWTGGISTSLTYKNFSFSAALDIRHGGKMFSRSKNIMEFTGNGVITEYNNRRPFIIPNSVAQVTNNKGEVIGYDENVYPIYMGDGGFQSYFDDGGAGEGGLFYMLDRDFVKLRNISITYNLPKKYIGPFQGIGLSAFVNNAFVWTPKENVYIDPESTNQGTDTDGLFGETYVNPSCRIYGFNVKIKF